MLPTDIEDNQTDGINLYTQNRVLHINMPYDALLSVYDVNGRLIVNTPVYTGNNAIPLNYDGIYVVKMTTSNTVVTHKIVVR